MVSESEIDEWTEIGGGQCAEAEKEEQAGREPYGDVAFGTIVGVESKALHPFAEGEEGEESKKECDKEGDVELRIEN